MTPETPADWAVLAIFAAVALTLAIVAVRGERPTPARLLLEHAQQHEAHTHQEAS